MSGRFAPTPSYDLHLGNLRTALAAWLAARASGREFLIRVEDLDAMRMQGSEEIAQRQLADLAELGLTHDGPVVHQKDRFDVYGRVMDSMSGRVYECFCSRKDILLAAEAPHGVVPAYSGRCRHLSESEKARLRDVRAPAWRVDTGGARQKVTDLLHGEVEAAVDDFVIRRADGVYSYNFAVVVDDGLQGVDQVVRGADLWESTPRQAWLATVLGFQVPQYAHIGLVYSFDGTRLAKRDHASGLRSLHTNGMSTPQILSNLAHSLGLANQGEIVTLNDLVSRFSISALPTQVWRLEGNPTPCQ